jgi:hypothetical protein
MLCSHNNNLAIVHVHIIDMLAFNLGNQPHDVIAPR